MSSPRGEGQDAIPADPTPILAPTDPVSTSTPSIPIASITAKANTVTSIDSTPEASEAMDSINIAEASGSSSAAPAASSSTSTAIPSDERPLPPTPTAPITPAKLLSLPLRSATETASAGEGSSSSATSAPAAPIPESTTQSQPSATPPQADTPKPASAPASSSPSEPASEPAPTVVALRSVIDRIPTPAPPTGSLTVRALPLPPPPSSNPDATSTVLRETVPPAPAPQPTRRVSIALPQSQSQSQSQNQAPLPPTPQPSSSRRLSQVEYIVPPWQSDREVMYCPICFVYFSLFNRKHHCRKCGRVVCNSCSPHRIVIPHAFIVQPPEVLAARERELAAAGASSSSQPATTTTRPSAAFPVSSTLQADGAPVGGERVRLCNPCVPDPNTSPPAAPGGSGSGSRSAAHSRSRSGSSIAGTYNYSSRRQGIDFSGGSSVSGGSGDRRYTISNGPSAGAMSSSSGRNPYYGSLPQHHSRSHRDEAGPSSHRQQQPRHQIPEEDECPVCHLELPKRTLENWEILREHHIEECITLHSQYMMGNNSSGGRNRATSTATASSGRSGASAQPTPARNNNNRHGNSVSGSDGTSSSVDSASSSESAAFSPSSPRAMPVHRHTGVFPYKATAKDCSADAECTICLEEFEVGDGMARLECFCRFHEQCIRAWFVRHPGRCPVHQHGMAD